MNDQREPPEKICIHFDWGAWTKPGKGRTKCLAGVEYQSVTHGPLANFCISTVPCYGMCPAATCERLELDKVAEVETETDQQPMLF